MSDKDVSVPNLLERYPLYCKLVLLAIVVAAALLPLDRVRALIVERQERQKIVASEIHAASGGRQSVVGPILVVPFGEPRQPAEPAAGDPTGPDETEDLSRLGSIHLLPQSLSVDSQVLAQRRSRGIYQALTYEADIRFTGRFSPPDLAALSIPSPDWLRWKGAQLKIYVAKLEATRLAEEIVWNGRRLPLRFDRDAGERGAILTADLAAAAPAGDWKADFAFEIAVNGSEGIGFQLLGRQSELSVTSDWPHPSFSGTYLPQQTQIDGEGFSAQWQVSRFGQRLPQQWRSDRGGAHFAFPPKLKAGIELRLLDPVDHYLMNERAVKYGLLFVILVFGAVFVVEALTGSRVHVVQYGMVAAALCLFFLLLLSLSEILAFNLAYWAAALPSLLLVAWYLARVTASPRTGVIVGGLLASIYGYLFSTLQAEDLALLLGSLLLFAALATAMVATRNVDWYALGGALQRRAESQAERSSQA